MRRLIGLLTLLVLLPAPVWAQQGGPAARRITVSAVGEVERAPEQAVVAIAVEAQAATAREATQQIAAEMERLLAALRQAGIDREDVRTTSYQLHPVYDHERAQREQREARLVGYRAVNMVQVTVEEVERVGRVIDTAVQAGADRITGLHFRIRDVEAARLEALELAIRKARTEAEHIARALGEPLGPALEVNTGGGYVPPPRPFMMEAAARMDVSTPIEPGTLTVSQSVTIVYAIGAP